MSYPPTTSLPQKPSLKSMIASSISPEILSMNPYSLDEIEQNGDKLNQNESSFDWPPSLKQKVCNILLESSWNCYPKPYPYELENKLAQHLDIPSSHQVLLTSGASRILEILTRHIQKTWIINSPCFSLYHQYCQIHQCETIPWHLNNNDLFCLDLLPDIHDNHVVLIASPNNPTGSLIEYQMLQNLLNTYPKTFFIVDTAYAQFSSISYLPLLAMHNNLIIIGTFSKTLAAAGIRIGYLIAASPFIEEFRKVLPPFGMNHLAVTALDMILQDHWTIRMCEKSIKKLVQQRERVYYALAPYNGRKGFFIRPSHGNFLLLRWSNPQEALRIYNAMKARKILLRNLTGQHGLEMGALRVTIGKEEQNTRFIQAFSELFSP